MKPQPAALGFRVKSGWAAAVLLTGPTRSPQLCDLQMIDLSDPRLPETRQPYHAAMGKLETRASVLSEGSRKNRLLRFSPAIGSTVTGSVALLLWWEARSIRIRSQIRTYARTPSKADYFIR
jgi:hypothetical protein